MGADGWVIQSKTAGDTALQLKVTTSAGDSYSDIAEVLDGNWHMLTWMVSFTDGKIYKVKDGTLLGNDNLAAGTGLLNTAYLNIGTGGRLLPGLLQIRTPGAAGRRISRHLEYRQGSEQRQQLPGGGLRPGAILGLHAPGAILLP